MFTVVVLDLSTNDAEDGYNIVKQYLDADYNRLKSLYDKIGKSAASDLIQKRKDSGDDYALWEIVEVMSFGEFIDLYQLYYSIYPSKENDFSNYLWSIKFLRNAAAHNARDLKREELILCSSFSTNACRNTKNISKKMM